MHLPTLLLKKDYLKPSNPLIQIASELDRQTKASYDLPVVLFARGLRKSFGGQVVLDGVDIELRRKSVILLDGANGSGKTTLINILTGNLQPDAGEIAYSANSHTAVFRFPQTIMGHLRPFHRFAPDTMARHGVGRTWQDVRMFSTMSLRDNISVAQPNPAGENPFWALFAKHSNADDNSELSPESVLKRVGLEGRENSSGDMISLGQSKRVAILRAVAAGAKILFLDEPLAGLDRAGIDEVLGLLRELVSERELTLVIVEHAFNQQHLRHMITERWHLENGQLSVCSPDTIVEQTSTVPEWFQTLTDAADEVITEQLPRGATLTRFRIAGRFQERPILEIKDLIVKRGRRTVIGLDDHGHETGFSLTIYQGEIAVLQAPNGWGKSTLFSGLLNLTPAVRGGVHATELDLGKKSTWEVCRETFIAVRPDSIGIGGLTILGTTSLAGVEAHAAPNLYHRRMVALSGGEKKMVFLNIATARSRWNSILLLDEPFESLTADAITTVMSSLKDSPFAAGLLLVPNLETGY